MIHNTGKPLERLKVLLFQLFTSEQVRLSSLKGRVPALLSVEGLNISGSTFLRVGFVSVLFVFILKCNSLAQVS